MLLNAADITTVSRLLDELLALPAADREAWLAALPGDQQRHGPILRAMLAREGSLDEEPLLSRLPRVDLDESVARPGDAVGPYRLLREIGRGGMGSVWLAERSDGAYRRQVALKLPRLAWGAGLAARMARERDIAALLEHPNIARLYDAGIDDRGRPYLALERIEGVTIDLWCREHGLGVRERLRLFLQVTSAVTHAHGRLVVHRDLKPSNVMVSPDGVVHLLDFGIARLLEGNASASGTGLTQQHGRVLTPHYAAPEQLAGEPVTVQADVYSLGVLLYELLTGQLPVEPRRGTPAALEDAVMRGDIPPASTRAAHPAQRKLLKGDIDAILAKALHREPAQRYAGVQALAQDIERHLAGESISARHEGALGRFRKAVRRHRLGVATAAVVLAAVLGGSAVAVLQARRALQAMERESAVKDFVAAVFRLNAPRAAAPGELRAESAEDFLQRSAALAERRFADRPALQADVYAMVGGALADMGAHKLASAYARRRVDLLDQAGIDGDERARAALQLAAAQLGQQALDTAQVEARRALALATSELTRVEARVLLARVLLAQDRRSEAMKMLELMEAAPVQVGSAAAWAQGLRARLLIGDNRLDQAEPMMQEAIRAAHASEGPDSMVAVELHLAMANVLASTTHADRAQLHSETAQGILVRRGGNHAVRAAIEAAAFAAYRLRAGLQLSPEAALSAIERSRRTLVDGGYVLPAELSVKLDLWQGVVLAWSGRPTPALPLLTRAHGQMYPSADSPGERRALVVPYALALQDSGLHDQADRWLREALRLRHDMGLAHHPHTALAHFAVAKNLVMAGRPREALAFLDAAPSFDEVPGEGARSSDRYNQLLKTRRAMAHLALGEWRQARATLPESLLANRGDRVNLLPMLGELNCAEGDVRSGLRNLADALDALDASGEYAHSPTTARVRAVMGQCALRAADQRLARRMARLARESFAEQPAVSAYYKAPLFELERSLGLRLPNI